MSAISLELPNSLYERLEELARRENVTIEQFVSTALAEKVSALLTEEYLGRRARQGTRDKFEQAMGKVPDSEPEEHDKL